MGRGVIMAVPCCQHELNRQIRNDLFAPVLRYGIVKERMAALLTDALRAELLGSRATIHRFWNLSIWSTRPRIFSFAP